MTLTVLWYGMWAAAVYGLGYLIGNRNRKHDPVWKDGYRTAKEEDNLLLTDLHKQMGNYLEAATFYREQWEHACTKKLPLEKERDTNANQ